MPSSRSPRPRSAAPICTSATAYIPAMEPGDILGHEFMGEVVEVGRVSASSRSATAWWCLSRSPAASASPARRGCTRSARTPIPTPGWRRSSSAIRWPGSSATRTCRRLRRRTGRVCAGALRRRRTAQGAGGHHRRAGALPLGHPAHRLHGRRDVRHPAGRHHRRLGLRARSGSSPSPAPSCSAPSGSSRIDRFPYRLEMARDKAGAETLNYEEVDVSTR